MSSPKTVFRTFFLAASLLAAAFAAQAGPGTVDVKQGASLQSQGALLIDVREPDEYAQGHAPGSTLIPLGQLEQRLHELSTRKDKPIALICRSGSRSAKAQEILEKAGFTKTVNIEGGMNAWARAGLPMVRGMTSK
jgi:rhodanese-related sulfurtransferase